MSTWLWWGGGGGGGGGEGLHGEKMEGVVFIGHNCANTSILPLLPYKEVLHREGKE